MQESEEEITADDWEEFRKREEVERKEREAREALEAKKRREEEKERLEKERLEKEREKEDEASSSSSSSRSRSRSRRKTQWDVPDPSLLEAAKGTVPPSVNPLAPQTQVVQPQVPQMVPAAQVQPPPPPAPVRPQPPEPGAFVPNGHAPGLGCQGLYQPMQAMRPMLPVQPLPMRGHMQPMPLPLPIGMQPQMLQQTQLPAMHQPQLQPMQLPGLQPMQTVRPAWGAWQAPNPVGAVPFQATEDRWMGRIKRYQDGPMGGYGFIDCDDLKLRYGRDVYIHKHQMAGLQIGDEVSFTIALNSKGEPQARNVIKASEALRGPVEPDPNLMDEQHARQFQASLRGV